MKKRILSMLLTIIMVISMLPVNALADDTEPEINLPEGAGLSTGDMVDYVPVSEGGEEELLDFEREIYIDKVQKTTGMVYIVYLGDDTGVIYEVWVDGEECTRDGDGYIQLPGYGTYQLTVEISAEGYNPKNTSTDVTWEAPASHDITVSTDGHGTVVVDETAPAGAEITVTVTPEPGYELDTLQRCSGGMTMGIFGDTFTMPESDVEIVATFKECTYTIASEYDSDTGIVTVVQTAKMDEIVEVTATPEEGYELESLTFVDAAGEELDITDGKFNMPAGNVIIRAIFNETMTYVAEVGGQGYETISAALAAANESEIYDEVYILAGSYDEEINIPSVKKQISIYAKNGAVVLTGGMSFGTDNGKPQTGKIYIHGGNDNNITFTGKGLVVKNLEKVTVSHVNFEDIEGNAIYVIGDTNTDNIEINYSMIDGATGAGIRIRTPKAVNITRNTIENVGNNCITIEHGSKYPAQSGSININWNRLENWADGSEDGRAVRIALGTGDAEKRVDINTNTMIRDGGEPEEIVKITGEVSNAECLLENNYWNGRYPLDWQTEEVEHRTYLTPEDVYIVGYSKTPDCTEITNITYVAQIDDAKYVTLEAAVNAAVSGDTIEVIWIEINLENPVVIDKSITLDTSFWTPEITGEFKLAEGVVLTASEGLSVTTDAEGYEVKYADGAYRLVEKVTNVAEVNGVGYATLADAIAKATAGATITFLADITEDVTISKNVTIDGAGKTFTGKMTLKGDTINIKNVNFDGKGYNGYAVETSGTDYLTIEECTAKNYGYGFVQLASATALTTVKNVEVSDMNYGIKIDYSNAVVLENVDLDCAVAGLLNSNYGAKPITIKDSYISILGTWTRNNTTKTTYVFEGANSVDKWLIEESLDNFKLAEGATLTAPNEITATTDVEGYEVKYADGKYQLVEGKESGTWGGIDWTLTVDGVLTIAPTEGEPVADPICGKTYEVGAWREAVSYNSKGEGKAIGGWPYDRSKVKTLIIEEGVTSIGSFTAQGFTNLTGEVVIPSTVTYIGQEAFQKSKFTKLTFAEGGEDELCIAQGAFKDLIIEEVALPADRPVHLHAWVFNNCHNLKYATLPATLVSVHGTNHIDYFKDFNAHSNPTWTKSSEIFAYDENLETITFGSEEVRDMFLRNDNNTSKDYIAATSGLVAYSDLQKAVDAAEEDGIVGLLKSGKSATVNKELTIRKNGKTAAITVGEGFKVVENADEYKVKEITYVVAMNDVQYESLQAAIDAIQVEASSGLGGLIGGGQIGKEKTYVITVLQTHTAEETITIDKPDTKITIDLNSCTLTGNILAPSAKLTVKNGKIINNDSSVSAIEVNFGALNLENVNIESARHAVRIDGKVETTIDGGTYKTVDVDAGVTQHVINVSNKGRVTILNGEFIGPKGTAADSGAAVNAQSDTTVYIKGGTFAGGKNNTLSGAGKITLTGGTFDQDPAAYVAEGYIAAKNGDGTWTVREGSYVAAINGGDQYESLQAALDAAKDGDTVTMLADLKLGWGNAIPGGEYPVLLKVAGKSITLDMNGKSINVNHLSTTDRIFAVICVEDGASLKVTGNGSIDVAVDKDTPKVAYMFWKRGTTGNMTIENGTFHMNNSEDSMVYTNGTDIVNVTGGNWTLDAIGKRVNGFPCIFNAQGNNVRNINVSGGTFNANPAKQYWAHEVDIVDAEGKLSYVKDNGDDTWTVTGKPAEVAIMVDVAGDYDYPYGYATFKEAVASIAKNAPETTIRLQKDITVKGQFIGHSYAQKVIIDLNTYKMSSTDKTLTVYRSGTEVTIINGTVHGNTSGGTIQVTYGGKLILGDGVKITSGGSANALKVDDNSTLIIGSDTAYVQGGQSSKNRYDITASAKAIIKISAGKFSQPVKAEWCVEGYMPNPKPVDGWYTVMETSDAMIARESGDNVYGSLKDVIEQAQNGETIVLMQDINVTAEDAVEFGGYASVFVVDNKTITLDMNGKTISFNGEGLEEGKMLVGVITTTNNAHLTITGAGTLEGKANGANIYALMVNYDKDCSIIIENGTFTLDAASDCLIYSAATANEGKTNEEGKNTGVIVKGGTFILDNISANGKSGNYGPWIFNAKGQGERHIWIEGGSFNADVMHQYWIHEVQMSEEKALKAENDMWTFADAICYVTESHGNYIKNVGFTSLEDAQKALDGYYRQYTYFKSPTADETIVLLADNVGVTSDTLGAAASAANVRDVQLLQPEVEMKEDIEIAENSEFLMNSSTTIDFNGNGKTITTNGTGTAPGAYDYGYVGFIPANGEDATVENVTVTGSGFVEVGHHGVSVKGNYTINKLTIKDLVATLSINNGGNNIAAAFSHYGNAVMTDCVMTGTTTKKEGFKPYDAAFVNSTTTIIKGGKFGTIYLANQAHVTITGAEIETIDSCAITTRNLGKLTVGAGAKIGTINLTPGKYTPSLVIEEGAVVGAIVYNGVTYTVEEWNAR